MRTRTFLLAVIFGVATLSPLAVAATQDSSFARKKKKAPRPKKPKKPKNTAALL